MPLLAIQGCQWGDEGKGKITDYFASKADVVVRSQGGNNAGHSIVHHGKRFALRSLPSGILSSKVTNVIANGCVVNPSSLLEEIKGLQENGIKDFKLLISSRAQIIMPYHIDLDKAKEIALGNSKIGTTGRGIGPCYEDKASRLGLRLGDLLEKDYLRERLSETLIIKNMQLKMYNLPPYDFETLYQSLLELGEKLRPYITDTSYFLNKCIKEKKKILFEGAQGGMLCLDHGTYPYVTSSSPLATAIPLNAGIPFNAIDDVVGLVKAYTSRVGEGPFPSELFGDIATTLRDRGHEYGTVTKRPRRVGWLDTQELKYIKSVTGITHIALMLLDVMSFTDKINICIGYELDGKKIDYMPSTISECERIKPIYEQVDSWKEDISNVTRYEDLPINAKKYIQEIERLTGFEVCIISVGPDKDQTIIRKEIF